jgi:hypothetical protein
LRMVRLGLSRDCRGVAGDSGEEFDIPGSKGRLNPPEAVVSLQGIEVLQLPEYFDL